MGHTSLVKQVNRRRDLTLAVILHGTALDSLHMTSLQVGRKSLPCCAISVQEMGKQRAINIVGCQQTCQRATGVKRVLLLSRLLVIVLATMLCVCVVFINCNALSPTLFKASNITVQRLYADASPDPATVHDGGRICSVFLVCAPVTPECHFSLLLYLNVELCYNGPVSFFSRRCEFTHVLC